MWKRENDNGRNEQTEFGVNEQTTNIKEKDTKSKKQSNEAHNDEKKMNNDKDSKKDSTNTYASNQNHKASKKEKISWIGTSISKVLDKKKVEKDLDVSLSVTRAYGIKDEPNAK